MRIEAVLFDADGVMQRRPQGWRDTLGELLGFGGNPSDFLADIFAIEVPALEGRSDFPEALLHVLSRWNCRATLSDALHVWTMIEVDPEITDTIRALRRQGLGCHLATNQERYKAHYMSAALGYCELFDQEFYSCRLGRRKPDGAYFRAILHDIELLPHQVLFVDDLQVNVDSARQVGLHAATFSLATGRDGLHRILREYGLHVAS